MDSSWVYNPLSHKGKFERQHFKRWVKERASSAKSWEMYVPDGGKRAGGFGFQTESRSHLMGRIKYYSASQSQECRWAWGRGENKKLDKCNLHFFLFSVPWCRGSFLHLCGDQRWPLPNSYTWIKVMKESNSLFLSLSVPNPYSWARSFIGSTWVKCLTLIKHWGLVVAGLIMQYGFWGPITGVKG